MELFDFIKVIFNKPVDYSEISAGEKRKHYFLCQRRFAIQFPMQANALQHLKINQSAVMDFWHFFLRKHYKFMPNWIYTKGVLKSKEAKEKKLTINNDIIREYCKTYKIDPKSVKDALQFYSSEMISELKSFESMFKEKQKQK